MEKYKENLKSKNPLMLIIGEFIESWPELNHITIYYSANPAKITNQKCTICHLETPIMVRYEKDHFAKEYWDGLCQNCAPKRIIDKLRGGGE